MLKRLYTRQITTMHRMLFVIFIQSLMVKMHTENKVKLPTKSTEVTGG